MVVIKTIKVFVTRFFSGIFLSLLGLYINFLILKNYGSDTNGLLATITQIISFFNVFEGGFGLATNIALYKPILDGDHDKVNAILSATKSIFNYLSLFVIAISLIISIVAPYYIKSNLDRSLISMLLLLSSIQLILQFSIYTKYEIIFSAVQKEYVIERVSVFFTFLSQFSIIAILYFNNDNILYLKFIPIIFLIVKYPIILRLFKKNFPKQHFYHLPKEFTALKDTKNVFAQKITALIFSSTDIILIAIFLNTKYASVYAVYNFVFAFLRMLILAFVVSPFNAFGHLNAQKDFRNLSKYFLVFSHLALMFCTIILNANSSVILPFVGLYTKSTIDINYIQANLPLFFTLNLFLEILSNIMATVLNSGGYFKDMKIVATIGTIINIIFSIILVRYLGIIGVLIGTFLALLGMVILQTQLLFRKLEFLNKKIFLKNIVVQFLSLTIGIFTLYHVSLGINTYNELLIKGFLSVISYTAITFLINLIFQGKEIKEEYLYICSIIRMYKIRGNK